MISQLVAVATGGAIGAVIRYLTNRLITHYFPANLYWATLFVNVIGCFLMGLAYVWFKNKCHASENLQLFITVGFLGALTTWSTFSMETVLMLNSGDLFKGLSYLIATFALCFMAFYLGIKFLH